MVKVIHLNVKLFKAVFSLNYCIISKVTSTQFPLMTTKKPHLEGMKIKVLL